MNFEKWIQNLVTSRTQPLHYQSTVQNAEFQDYQEQESWLTFKILCERAITMFNRHSSETLKIQTDHHEIQIILGCCQLSFQFLTGMIRTRLTRVSGYKVETLIDHGLRAQHDNFGGLYWCFHDRVLSEDMLVRMTLEALIKAQPPLSPEGSHEHSLSRTRS